MASQTHVKRALLCFSLITLSFVFFFFLNDSPKNEDIKRVIGTKRLSSDVVSTVEIRGKYTPPESWTKFEGQRSETEEELESAILGVDAPIAAAAEMVGDADIDINDIRSRIVDEEKLREKLVMEDPTWVSWQKMNQVRYLSLLTGASIASSVVCHPLHVIMMRQQVGAMSARGGMMGVVYSVQEAIETLGLRGLFRGWVPLMLEAPSHALYFSCTESSREFLQAFFKQTFYFFGFQFTFSSFFVDIFQSLISALIANAVSLIPWVPAEILSAKLAIQDRKGAIGMNEMIAQIYRKEGIFGFFKGFFSSLAVHVTYSFLWWVSYSTTRRQVEVFFPTLQRDNLLFYDAITGILAGLASGFLNHPMDTIKLRIQTECDEADEIKEMLSRDSKDNFTYFAENNDLLHDNKNEMFYDDKYEKYSGFRNSNSNLKNLKKQKINHNLISMGMLIVKKDGISALFSGIGAAMYSTIFSSAFFCIIYEMIKRESTI